MPIVRCEKCGSNNRLDPSAPAKQVAKCGRCGAILATGAGNESRPVIVTDASFSQDVLNSGGVVLLDCWAPWCGPCRMVGPIMEQLATESAGRYRIAKLNVDENPATAGRFQIQSIPTMLLFKNGQLIDRLIGAQPKQAIAARINQALS